jgi:hypothetical protein
MHPIRVLVGQQDSDEGAHRVPDRDNAFHAEVVEGTGQVIRLPGQTVKPGECVAAGAAAEVGCHNTDAAELVSEEGPGPM